MKTENQCNDVTFPIVILGSSHNLVPSAFSKMQGRERALTLAGIFKTVSPHIYAKKKLRVKLLTPYSTDAFRDFF